MPRTPTPPAPPRRIEYLPLTHLVPDDRNPKDHDLDLLGESFTRFGLVEPQVLDERTGKLVAGHGRLAWLAAAAETGAAPPDGITVDEAGAWLVPVVRGWASRDDDDAARALVALNRTTERGGWRDDALAELLATLDGDLTATGFTDADLDDLLAVLGDEQLLPIEDTDAAYADLPDRADPAAPRAAQGIREVVLMFPDDEHDQYVAAVEALRRLWGPHPTGTLVLRALAYAAGHAAPTES